MMRLAGTDIPGAIPGAFDDLEGPDYVPLPSDPAAGTDVLNAENLPNHVRKPRKTNGRSRRIKV
jgi:hypothetical protein